MKPLLNPCPRCGSGHVAVHTASYGRGNCVRCEACLFKGPAVYHPTPPRTDTPPTQRDREWNLFAAKKVEAKQTAIDKWNGVI